MSNYVQRVKNALKQCHPKMDDRLIDFYALLVLVSGEETTLENVHDAWSLWKNDSRPDHRSLIPFDQLSEEIQATDFRFMESIRLVSRIKKMVDDAREKEL